MRQKSKLVLSVLIGLMMMAALVGCGQADKVEKKSVEEEQASVRKISTEMGEIEVPTNPKRVVVNWYVGDAFALDLNVVGYLGWAHEAMPFYDQLNQSVKIENWEPEEVMKLEPDLIITYSKEDFAKFSKVAPVLVVSEEGITPLERVKIIGEAVGKSDKAEAAVAQFEKVLAQSKEKVTTKGLKEQTISITEDNASNTSTVSYETGSRGGTLIYEYLKLKKPAKIEEIVQKTKEGRGALSYEVAADYFGDYMIWLRPYDAEVDGPSTFEQTPIWNTIPAVKDGKVVIIPSSMNGLFYYSDVLSLTAQMEYMVNELVKLN